MSTKSEGLQNCLDKFANYCSKWGLSMNYKKTKIMIFNKGGKLIKCSFSVNDYKLECVKEYKYLGLLIGCGGNFSTAISDLVNRGQKAFFKVKSIFKYGIPSIHTILKAFDHTVKPVLLYSSEVWGMFNMTSKLKKSKNDLIYDLYNDHKIEKLNLNLCKSILGVGSKASNLAVVGELGRYPLYIDIVISMIKYWIRLHEDKTNCILKAALDENNKMHNNGQHCWVSCIYYILKELDMLKMFKSPLTCGAREINIIRKKLKERYTKIWREKINLVKQNPATNRNENKLRTYCKFKFIFQQEKYLDNIKELSNRSTLARFRISAHKLEIERGRYTIPKTAVENRICKQCNCEAVEDEEHLLIKCNKYSFARNTFFSNINNNFFPELSDRNKFIWLLSNEDREICKNLANFIATCLSIRDLSDK